MNQLSWSRILLFAVSLIAFTTDTVLARSKRGIRSADFRNFAYDSKQSINKIVLHNGHKVVEEMPGLYAKDFLISVRYIDFDGDGKEEAAVRIGSTTNGSMVYSEEYYVFAYRNGKAVKVFHEWREQPKGMKVRGRSIIIVAPSWEDAYGHCCPNYIEAVTYRWEGSRFVVKSRRRKIVHYPN